MEFLNDLILDFFKYLPLICGAYISILVLRFPDLTIEASWNIAAISSCLFACRFSSIPPWTVPAFGFFVGMLCGCLTSVLFIITGRAKLLAGLISYYVLMAIGYHLLGDSASIYLEHKYHCFGFLDGRLASLMVYVLISSAIVILVVIWQRSSWGIKARIIGENSSAANFYRISLDRHFSIGLIFSNAIVGLGGGLWGIYYGSASNAQGIGLVIIAFLALLIGDELVKLLRLSRRTEIYAILVGCFIFVFLSLISETAQLEIAMKTKYSWFRSTDKQIIVAIVLVTILLFRRRKRVQEGEVSEW